MLTLVYTYYDNPMMLAQQYLLWASYPAELKSEIKIIIVDDASPKSPAIDVARPDGLPEIEIYRVMVDVPWHQDGARNLGADRATTPWIFVCDIDHALPEKYLWRLLKFIKTADRNKFYTFNRKELDGSPVVGKDGLPKPAFNIYVMTRDLYWKNGGYDEDLCGYYGTDGAFRRRLSEIARMQHLKQVSIVRYGRSQIPDASTTAFERKTVANSNKRDAIKARKKARGRQDRIATLEFEWQQCSL